ncbi:exonuclease domain-containing protein [Streptomyces zaomyceticus]|uniref:exonuclease domain-containing protein n=1 Tax=Streptomyces zaomyceticus TaxID=68286 RepID=UPI002E125A8C|nr:exonuclease domain-containing protein [Streptomyces zaomyceticus]
MWHKTPMVAFDLETTGVDVEADRIVTAAVIDLAGEKRLTLEWLADPGIEIPEGATAVHGITTEHAREKGERAPVVVDQIAESLAVRVQLGSPVVGHNVPYDLTLLDRELRRYELVPLQDRLDGAPLHVIDTRVLDQHCLPYRKRVSETQGARQLITLAQVYSLPWDAEAAHGCSYDALIAARIAYRIGTLAHTPRAQWPQTIRFNRRPRFHELDGLDLAQLHELQITLAAEQAAGLQEHFRKTNPDAVVDGSWPLRPWEANRV